MSIASRILLALAAGLVSGLLLEGFAGEAAFRIAAAVEPVGRLWLSALQMTVVPLVFSLLVVAVAMVNDAASTGRVARRALLRFLALLSCGALFAAFFAPVFMALVPRDEALVEALRAGLASADTPPTPRSIADWLSGLVPSNAVAAAAQGAILPLVVFTLCFGFALTRIDSARRERMVEFFRTIADTMIVLVRWILLIGPIGVFALILPVAVRAGVGVVGAIGWYVLLQCALYLAIIGGLYLLLFAAGRRSPAVLMRGLLPAQAIALSTSSSLATLPAMVEAARYRLAVTERTADLVLPLAVSLFRMTSPARYLAAAVFVAWLYGIELGTLPLVGAAFLAVAMSLGAVGLPGQVSFMGTHLPVAQSLDLPLEPFGLLLAVDPVHDSLATVGNVSADLAAAVLLDPDAVDD